LNKKNTIKKILNKERISEKEAVYLYEKFNIIELGELAETRNEEKAYFNINKHINPTNICVNRCKFCAFSRNKGDEGSYEYTIEKILKYTENAEQEGITEFHVVGGLHPEWSFEYYKTLLKELKKAHPHITLKTFTAVEIDYFSKITGYSVAKVLEQLKEAGMSLMPGGGAEIFHSDIRNKICPEKISGERWLKIIETAHNLGIRTNCTMLYGHIENIFHRIEHLKRLRQLQDKTGGFLAFIPLSFHSKNTEIKKTPYTTGTDDLKTIAISRLFLDNIPNIKAYWVMLTEKLAQVALNFGANDLDGTVVKEKITHFADALSKEGLTVYEIINLIKKAGKVPVERDSFYNELKIFS
jgi:aminodeoxyfutalosine synthase